MRISSAYIDRLTVGTLNINLATYIDHGGLSGLDDDDHSIYLTTGRADSWLGTKDLSDLGTSSHNSLTDIGTDSHATIDSHIDDATIHFLEGSIDHGSIAGLGDDDHSIYTLREDWLQNGFVNKTTSTLTWTDSIPDYTLSIQPTGASFDYYVTGVKYTSTGDTVQIDDTKEGIHFIYYDTDGNITSTANPTLQEVSELLRTTCFISIVYWDVSESAAIYVGEERHGANMSPESHTYLHFIEGLAYFSGLGLNTISADGAGATADAQFGVDTGTVSDEDLFLAISAVNSTTGLPIYYMTGAAADWNKYTEAGFSVRTLDGTSADRLAYNQYTGGAWQLTEVGNSDFVLYHVFATTEKDKPMISVMGQAAYATVKLARAGAQTEVKSLILDDILFPEIRPIATVIFQTNLTYASTVNARIVSTEEGDDYVDWRSEVIDRVSLSTTDHGSLTGLADDDHTIYSLVDGTRAFTGAVSIYGSADTEQLVVRANATQANTNPLIQLQKSDGTPIAAIHTDDAGSIFIGVDAGKSNALSGVQGYRNTFIGYKAAALNTTGSYNIAIGVEALYNGETASSNICIGYRAGMGSAPGGSKANNFFLGSNSGRLCQSGTSNIGIGLSTLYTNSIHSFNVGIGTSALNKTAAHGNTGIGDSTLVSNTSGTYNVAIGYRPSYFTQTGDCNTAVGGQAGYGKTLNSYENNALFGYKAGFALETGSNNLLLGYQCGDNLTTGSDNIIIGYDLDAPAVDSSDYLNIGGLIKGDTLAETLLLDGDTTVSGFIDVISAVGPVTQSTRTTAGTGPGAYGALQIKALTSSDMIDGFGVGMVFHIEDDTSGDKILAELVVKRNGADDSGKFEFATYDTGTPAVQMSIDSTGYTTIENDLEVVGDIIDHYTETEVDTISGVLQDQIDALPGGHDAITVTDTPSVDLTLVGQLLQADVTASGVDHGALAGLDDDDHSQYQLALPPGAIIPFNLLAAKIATDFTDGLGDSDGDYYGWAICNGSNGTPDLSDKFVRQKSTGAGGSGGSTSGAHAHGLSNNGGAQIVAVGLSNEILFGTDTGPNFSYTDKVQCNADTGSGTSASTALVGDTDSGSILPAYYDLVFLMKV